jgi:hypothetical protein
MDTPTLRTHIEKKIKRGKIELSPFPHLIIENFFPNEVYSKIIEYNLFKNNPGKEWLHQKQSDYVTSSTPYHARKQINFHEGHKYKADEDVVSFWQNITDCFLADNWFPNLIHKKFPDYFRLRFGDLVDAPDFHDLFKRQLFLQRHEPGYYIGPHTDIPTRVFTCIFSFADKPGFEQFGTELLVPKDRMVRCWGNDHYSPDAFEVKKLAPYKPNNFLLFFKTRQSFHSVRAIDDTVPNQRFGMQFQYYEPSGGLLKDWSAPDLMSKPSTRERDRARA